MELLARRRTQLLIAEWQLIFHEILLISNNLREIVNDSSMDHSETKVHHDLTGRTAEHFNSNMGLFLDFVCSRGNPFIIQAPGIKLHNLFTKQIAEDEMSVRLHQALVNGDRCYQEFRQKRFLEKKSKLSATISKRNLPRLDSKSSSETSVFTMDTSQKTLAAAQHDIDIVKERGMSLESVFSHDILPTSIIFEDDLASKPHKSDLIKEIEKHLVDEDKVFPYGDAAVIVDFMSRIHMSPNLLSFKTFGNVIRWVFSASNTVCSRTSLHIVFDSYIEHLVKGGERTRRALGIEAIDMAVIGPDVPIPQQIDKFWPSPSNKTKLQSLTRALATEQQLQIPIVISGCVVNDELVPAELISLERSSDDSSPSVSVDSLTSRVEEADDRLVLHCAWEVARGCVRLLVISNDTDTVVTLLCFITEWQAHGLRELWVQFGSGEHRRHLPIHILAERLGPSLCRVLVKAHVLTGNDALSKIGTKHAALTCEPEKYLVNFGEFSVLSEESFKMVEEFLVRVWTGAGRKTSSQTFDQARLEMHIKGAKPLPEFPPPTSSVIAYHIQRSLFIAHNVLSLLNDHGPILEPTYYGWFSDSGSLLPVKGLKSLPDEELIVCKCGGRCHTKRCPCRKAGQLCVIFCHESQECQNK